VLEIWFCDPPSADSDSELLKFFLVYSSQRFLPPRPDFTTSISIRNKKGPEIRKNLR
jgi:hypothetical protein